MSRKVFLKIPSAELARYGSSQSCLNSLNRCSNSYMPKFIEPMLSEASSGWNSAAGFSRSATVMVTAPPVVMLITTSEAAAILGRNRR